MSNINCKYGCKNGKIFMPKLGEFVDCPEHSKKKINIEEVKVKDDITLADALFIPEQYRGLGVVDRALFTRNVLDTFSQTSINSLGTLLEKINKNLYNGLVPKISCYIHAPAIIDIKHFIYASQKLALQNGLSVVPYISANRLYEVQSVSDFSLDKLSNADKLLTIKNTKNIEKLSTDILSVVGYNENMSAKEVLDRAESKLGTISTDILNAVEGYRHLNETGLTYRDYIRADLCYICITSNTKNNGFYAISDILAERSMRNLPTFVFGFWPSTSGKTGDHLRYLISRDSTSRLDLLAPFDLTSKYSKARVVFDKNLDNVGGTKSDIVAGYRI